MLGLGVLVSRVGGWVDLRVETSRVYRASALMGISNGRRPNCWDRCWNGLKLELLIHRICFTCILSRTFS